MKIRVYGPCGSGKSYFSKKLAKALSITLYVTDNMIWNRSINEKFSREDREKNLDQVLALESWIIEGAQYKWSFNSFLEADIIIHIDPRPLRLTQRVTWRYVKMKFGIETFNYTQSLKELFEMYVQNHEYYKETKHDFDHRIKARGLNTILLKDSDLNDSVTSMIIRKFEEIDQQIDCCR